MANQVTRLIGWVTGIRGFRAVFRRTSSLRSEVKFETALLREEIARNAEVVRQLEQEIAAFRDSQASVATEQEHSRHVVLGEGARIVEPVNIIAPSAKHQVRILAGAVVNRDCEISGPMTLGKRSFIHKGGFIQGHVRIGISVAIGPYVRFVSDNHDIGTPFRRAGRSHSLPIVVGNGVWIGASVTILGGVTVGDGSIVGAGALVTNDVPPNTIVAGVPARVIRRIPEPPS